MIATYPPQPEADPRATYRLPLIFGGFLLQALRYRFRTALLVAAVCVAASILYLIVASPVYTVSADLYVARDLQIPTGQLSFSAPDHAFLHTQSKVLKSTPILAIALGDPEVAELGMLRDVNRPIEYLRDRLLTEVGQRDETITLGMRSSHPGEATRLIAAIVDAYLSYQSAQRRSETLAMLETIQKQRQEQQEKLARKRDELLKFKGGQDQLSLDDENIELMAMSLRALSEALGAARMQAIDARTAYAEAAAMADSSQEPVVVDVGALALDENSIAAFRASLADWEQRVLSLRQQYLPAHPRLRSAETRLKQLRATYIAAMEKRSELARQREDELERAFAGQQAVAARQASRIEQYTRVESDAKSIEKMIAMLDGHLATLDLAGGSRGAALRLLEPAAASKTPVSPRALPVLLMGVVTGLFMGAAAATARELLQPKLRSAEQIAAALRLPVLGSIPHTPEQSLVELSQIVRLQPQSPAAMRYRSIRSIINGDLDVIGGRTLLIASPSETDGRTSLAVNLALSLAMTEQKVLLIDANAREPLLHELFTRANDRTLFSVLEGIDTWNDAVQHTQQGCLHLLPGGSESQDASSDLLNSDALVDLLSELSKEYDRIVIDSPAIASSPDARIISACCDATVLVIRGDQLRRKESERVVDDLVSVGARMTGVIVNCANIGAAPYPPSMPPFDHHGYVLMPESESGRLEAERMI